MRSTVAILGTGLIGTSLGLALLQRIAAPRVIGWDARPSNARAARRRGGLTEVAESMEDAVRDAGIVVIATPLDAAIELVPDVIKAAAKGALVIDVTPVKTPMLRAVRPALRRRPDVGYVSAHPMAGREQGGPSNADPALFEGRPFALVMPGRASIGSEKAFRRASRFVKMLAAHPIRMTAAAHDCAVAAMSALPQLASIALTLAASDAAGKTASRLAGPGYKDATRLAMSPYDIWRPAIAANRREILRCLRALERSTARIARAARQADVRAMERLFSKAQSVRKRVVAG